MLQTKVENFEKQETSSGSLLQKGWVVFIFLLIGIFIKSTLEAFAQQHAKQQDEKMISKIQGKRA